MCAQYQDIEPILVGAGLVLPTLNVLTPDLCPYDTLLIQTTGAVSASREFVGHADHEGAIARFRGFLKLAIERNVDLALTPEYSCPWEALLYCIAHNQLPAQGKLWAIACESITPTELQAAKDAHPNVVWLHEPMPQGSGQFLDVLAYLTKATRTDGEIRNVVVLQFKSHPMGGIDFEQKNLILGSRVYIWRNPADNIRLMTLICSEALAFTEAAAAQCRCELHPYIILHPQLSLDPRHANAAAYRAYLFAQNDSDHLEVVTLNWARRFVLPGEAPSAYGGSAIFTKAPEFDLSDACLDANHKKGMFYSYWHAYRTQLCVLSFDEHIFNFRIHKTRQVANAVEARRSGPQMVELWSWDDGPNLWRSGAEADDGFLRLCNSYQQAGCDYYTNSPTTAIDRERLLTLTAGKLLRSKDWHKVTNLPPFIAESDERTKRLTFTHEPATASTDFRKEHLQSLIKLQMAVLSNPTNFPPTIQDLRGNWKMHPPKAGDDFRFNLGPAAGNQAGATAIFLGMIPPEDAVRLRDDLVREWTVDKTRRLVVWYEHGGAIQCSYLPEFDITSGSDAPGTYTAESNS